MDNKKADSKILSVWWFFVLVIIGVGIVAGVLVYSNYKVDVRQKETEILADRVLNCLSNKGYLNENIFSEKTNIFDECGLDRKILESGKYYLSINFNIPDTCTDCNTAKISKQLKYGNYLYQKDCEVAQTVVTESYPSCLWKTIFVLNSNGDKVIVTTLVASNYKGE